MPWLSTDTARGMFRPGGATNLGVVEVQQVLRALGGSALSSQLVGHVSRRALRAAVADGRVLRVGRAYCLPGGARAADLACTLRATRSHTTAAEHWGWSLPPTLSPTVRLTVPFKAQRRGAPEDVTLYYRDLADPETVGGVTSRLRTVVDCLRDEDLRTALSVGDSALREGDVARGVLVAAVDPLRGPRSARARGRLGWLDGRAANAFESSCRAILIEAGITGFEPQVNISHRGQWIGRVDLADVVRRIVIECDGFETHGTLDAMTRDAVRHTWLVSAGWRPLRLTWYQVMHQPGWVLERVRDTIEDVERTRIAVQRSGRRSGGAA